jgi:hypothetical protein
VNEVQLPHEAAPAITKSKRKGLWFDLALHVLNTQNSRGIHRIHVDEPAALEYAHNMEKQEMNWQTTKATLAL